MLQQEISTQQKGVCPILVSLIYGNIQHLKEVDLFSLHMIWLFMSRMVVVATLVMLTHISMRSNDWGSSYCMGENALTNAAILSIVLASWGGGFSHLREHSISWQSWYIYLWHNHLFAQFFMAAIYFEYNFIDEALYPREFITTLAHFLRAQLAKTILYHLDLVNVVP